MPNPYHTALSTDLGSKSGSPPEVKPGHKPGMKPESTAAWPGVPGKTQPRTRDKAGTPKCKVTAKSEGL